MALFVDGNMTSIPDLAAYESSIVELAATEGIDLTAKSTVAAAEAAVALQRFLARTPGAQAYTLGQVAQTGALRRWHALLTLASTFRDAHFQQLNDRHGVKWREYERLARAAGATYFETGVGIVLRPLPRPMPPVLDQVAGPEAARTYYVRTAWLNAEGEESLASETATLTTLEGTALMVRAVGAPPRATGWNIYAGWIDDGLMRQNAIPVPLGSPWTMPGTGLAMGLPPGTGQEADLLIPSVPVLQRG